MGMLIEEIQAGLKEEIWSSAAVQAVIASKEDKREKKGLHFPPVYTLDVSVKGSINPNEVILNKFVDQVYELVKRENKPLRFQLAMKTSAVHWTAVDIVITPEHGVKIVNIDSAGDVSGATACSSLYEKFKKKYGSEANQNSRLFFLKHDDIPGTDKQRQIQYDKISCSRFALTTLFHLATMNPFPMLEERKDQFSRLKTFPTEYKFNATNMPPEMAAIYRDTQSKTAFNSLPLELKRFVINKKGETLEVSERRHTEEQTTIGEVKQINFAIAHKRTGFIEDTEKFLLANEDAIEKIESKDALAALERQVFLPVVHRSTIVRQLIDEAQQLQQIEERARRFSSFFQTRRNTHQIKSANKECKEGHLEEALSYLERMSGMPQAYKEKLNEAKKIMGIAVESIKFTK